MNSVHSHNALSCHEVFPRRTMPRARALITPERLTVYVQPRVERSRNCHRTGVIEGVATPYKPVCILRCSH
jgi:hypothetical protein